MKNIDFQTLLRTSKATLAGARKFLWAIGKHAFLAILFLVLLDVLLGIFLFYKYALLAQAKTDQVNNASFQFKDDIYQKVLNQQEARSQKLKESLQEDYPSPF